MRTRESPGTLKRFRRTGWEFQRTFKTPSGELPRFVDAIVSALPEANGAIAVFEEVVFEPRYNLVPLYAKYSLPDGWAGEDFTIEAQDAVETRELLEAMLSEWIDFLFVPTPKRFLIYADHDDFTTFFAHRKSYLSAVVDALTGAKFRAVDYIRKL